MMAFASPPAFPTIPAERLLASWTTLARRQRHRLLASAADTLARSHLAGVNLSMIDPSRGVCTLGGAPPLFQLDTPPKESPEPVRMEALLNTLLLWRTIYQNHLSELEMALFLARFGECSGVPRPLARTLLSEIISRARRESSASAVGSLRHLTAKLPGEGALWRDLPDNSLPDELESATAAAGTRILKRSPASTVYAASIRGEDVVIKEFNRSASLLRRMRASFGPCKAARAWAASRAMSECGIPTPKALGFACRGEKSWVVTRWMTNWVTLRDWIKPHLHLRPEAERHAAEDLLLKAVTNLLNAGFWHADMKPSNLLVPENGPSRVEDFLWIDLECVAVGTPITRDRLLRNLAQLNGGIGRHLPREDRLRFLRRLAGHFPFLKGRATAAWVERETRRRLLREVRRECSF